MNRSELIRIISAELASSPVVVGYLMGSRARGTERPDSDTDVACLLERGTDQLAGLAALTVRLEAAGVPRPDVHLLNAAPLAFQAEAVLRGLRIYCSDAAAGVGFEAFVTTRYLDFEPILRLQYRIQRRRLATEGRLGSAPRG